MAINSMTASKWRLGDNLKYAMDPQKTENGRYVSGINCIPRLAEKQFLQTKEFWSAVKGVDKTKGVKSHVGYISFKGDEIDPQTALRIGVELAERLWGNSNEVVVATHLNTTNIHDHFVINSVSWRTGEKSSTQKKCYINFKKEAKRIRQEYGLSSNNERYANRLSRPEYLAEQEGKPTMRNIIRWDIDRAIKASLTLREFTEALEKMGYRVVLSEGNEPWYPGLFPPGGNKCFSFRRLGSNYELSRVKERILENKRRVIKNRDEIEKEVNDYRKKTEPVIQRNILSGKWKQLNYELELLVKYPESVNEIPIFIRQEIILKDRIKKYIDLLDRHDIRDEDMLSRFVNVKETRMNSLIEERNLHKRKQRNANRRGDEEEADKYRTERLELTKQIKVLRNDIRTAKEVSEQSSDLDGKLALIKSLHEVSRGTEEREDEQLYGRSDRAGLEDNDARS